VLLDEHFNNQLIPSLCGWSATTWFAR